MLTVSFGDRGRSPQRILFVGAHADDIEIGCGGTLLRLLERDATINVTWVVMGCDEQRAREALESAHALLTQAASKTVIIKAFRDGFFPSQIAEIKECFEQLKAELSPDLVFTHHRHDLHQDHRLVAELTWNTFRDHLILEYEIPKYDGDFGSPNVLVPLDEDVCREKVDHIVQCFKSQATKTWFSADLFTSVMRIRGMEDRAATGYAEGFYGRKLVVALGGPS